MTLEEEAANRETNPERLREMAFQSHEIDMIIASNSKTPQDVIEKLAKSDNNEIRKVVATNANTPPDLLLDLGKDFPEELLANPVFNLMLLANPNLLKEIPEKTLISILKLANVRESFVIFALNHRQETKILAVIIANHVQIWNNWRKNNSQIEIKLNWANWKNTDLSHANLSGVNLTGVKLDENTQIDQKWRLVWDILNNSISQRDLKGVDLSYAYLRGTNLRGANLSEANLIRANLIRANLTHANLSGVDLSRAYLRDTNLKGADLSGANLSGTYLKYADLSGANLRDVKLSKNTQIDKKWL